MTEHDAGDDGVHIDIEFVDSLPGGILCQPITAPGRWTMLVVKGEMSDGLAAQMEHQFRAAVRLGLWRQGPWPDAA